MEETDNQQIINISGSKNLEFKLTNKLIFKPDEEDIHSNTFKSDHIGPFTWIKSLKKQLKDGRRFILQKK